MNRDFVLHLPKFEGPLDLLLYLIEKNRFTLEDLEVCPIIDQYLEYLACMRSLDITLAGEFLDMASYLIWIKSCLLLPAEVGEPGETEAENPVRELQEMLLAYRAIKETAVNLKERLTLFRDKYPRGRSDEEKALTSMSMASLLEAINAIKARTKQYVLKVTENGFNIREMTAKIYSMLKSRERILLTDIPSGKDRSELVAVFLAALEISKSSVAGLIQDTLFSDIYIVRR